VRKSQSILLWTGDGEQSDEEEDDWQELNGVIRDPSLGGHKELFMLYSKEFQVKMKHSLTVINYPNYRTS